MKNFLVLWSIDYVINNKQINHNCFLRILRTMSRMPLKFATNKLNINCFYSIFLTNQKCERQCLKKEIWYSINMIHSPLLKSLLEFLWSWELASLSPSAPGMFGSFLEHKIFFWLTIHSNCTNHNQKTFLPRTLQKDCVVYIVYKLLMLYIVFTGKISPGHFCCWGGLVHHLEIKTNFLSKYFDFLRQYGLLTAVGALEK